MKIFTRDKKALDTAIFSSLNNFKFVFKEFEGTHDLETIYHSIRSDAMRNARSSKNTDLKLFVETEAAKEEHLNQTKEPPPKKSKFADNIGYDLAEEDKDITAEVTMKKVDDKVEVVSSKIVSKPTTKDVDLVSEIKKLHAEGHDAPAVLRDKLQEIHEASFDIKEVRKLHYKIKEGKL